MITLCLTFWETAKILCKATRLSCIPSSLPASYAWVFQFLYMCGNVFYAPSVFLPQPLLLLWEVSLWLWHTSPWWLVSNNEHCFKCYLFLFLLEKVFIQVLCPFLNGLLVFLTQNWKSLSFSYYFTGWVVFLFTVTCCRAILVPIVSVAFPGDMALLLPPRSHSCNPLSR